MDNDLLVYQIALTLIPQIGPVQAKILLEHLEPDRIFKSNKKELGKIEGIGEVRAGSILQYTDFREAESEVRFLEKYKIVPLFLKDPAYPQRLLDCYDSPTLLYYKGNANLNAPKIISIIGSRTHTEYGRQCAEKLIQDLAPYDPLIVSGLAYGIDGVAHRSALKNGIPTVGVMAHGLDQIYPSEHSRIAKDMIQAGGLLSEFRSGTKPDKHNFPIRNRIVAGISDATVVIETAVRGGSMITAELANGYNKEVLAFPGRIADLKSAGCNHLIKSNKAILLTDATQLAELMGWEETKKRSEPLQTELFAALTGHEQILMGILKQRDAVHIDELNRGSGLSSSSVAAAILNLELQNLISSRPGKRYGLCPVFTKN